MDESSLYNETEQALPQSNLWALLAEMRARSAERGVELNPDQLVQLGRMTQMLLEWNSRFNLTAIRDVRGIVYKHLLDSLAPSYHGWAALSGNKPTTILDVGSGAGFPAIPLAIAFPEIRVTALESSRKKSEFISLAAAELGLDVRVIRGRAETQAKLPLFREKFDLVVARAVAYLPALAEYCLPFARVGGFFVAMKSESLLDEIEDGVGAVEFLGGRLHEPTGYVLPEVAGERWLLAAEKVAQTPGEYPRDPGVPSRKPLVF